MNQNPIFILGAHKSGTSLLRSLLDGHSQLFVIPVETHFFENMRFWVDNEYRRQRPEIMTKESILQNFCDQIHHFNTVEDTLADSVTTGLFDENQFRKSLSQIPFNKGNKAILEGYFESLYQSIEGQTLSPNLRVVEKSVENAEFADLLAKYFPNAKFIRILRNPYANFVALRRYKSRGYGYPIIRRLVRTLYNSYYFMYKNKRILENYRIIRYADLVTEPEKQIRNLCDFLEIPFESILLTPTFRGKPWRGNSTTGNAYSGIDASYLDRWKTLIHPLEVTYINKLFPFILRDYNYELFQPGGSFWKPIKGENPKRYFANRFYKYFLQEWKN